MGRITTKDFINRAFLIHGGKYDYSKVMYIKMHNKIMINCPHHGSFMMKAQNHLRGQGCPICGKKSMAEKQLYTTKFFIKKAKEVHGSRYNYDEVKYINSQNKIIINCPIHGSWKQLPAEHLRGFGCTECGREYSGWSFLRWKDAGENSLNFDSFKLYFIKVWNEEEEFIKIGKTFTTIGKRFAGGNTTLLPYNYCVIKIIEGSALYISKLELEIHSSLKEYKYMPNINFKGVNECFNTIDARNLIKKYGTYK